MRSIPPRLRAPVIMLVGGAIIATVVVVAYGWGTLRYQVPTILAAAAGYYVWSGRDSDYAALLRRQPDERQAYRRLKMEALAGRVTTGAAFVAFLAAFAVKATLWPFFIFLTIPCVTFFVGWAIYREHDDGLDDGHGNAEHWLISRQ
jgi:hypothetical protein